MRRATSGMVNGLFLAPILAAAVLATACTQNGGAIFATIQDETVTETSNLDKAIVVYDVLELRAGGTRSYLAVARQPAIGIPAAGGTVTWSGGTTNELESEADPGTFAEVTDSWCRAGVLHSGSTAADDRVLAVFAIPGSQAETTALYAMAPDAIADLSTSPSPVIEWSLVATSATFAGESPEGLLLVEGELFVPTRRAGVLPRYGLFHFDLATETATSVVPDALNLYSPVTDGALHGPAVWFVAGGAILTGDADGPLAIHTDAVLSSSAGYGGIHRDPATGSLHLSSRDGVLFVRASGVWTASKALTLTGDSTPLVFTDFMSLAGSVYVGSVGRGFFRLAADGILTSEALAGARGPNRTISELYAGTIRGFAPLTEVVFLWTAGAGLWHQVLETDLSPVNWLWD